jgi:hypothetical protein
MAKQFLYPPINSLAMQLIQTFPSNYNSVPFDYQNDLIPYLQKRQTDDIEYLQCFSDWAPVLYIYDYKGIVKATIDPSTPVTSIIGQTYTCYEFEINWNEFAAGNYYAEIKYTDDSETVQIYQSRPIGVASVWPQTLLFQYTNSQNRFGVVFQHTDGTFLTFNLRVEGNIPPGEFSPAFENVVYTDEEYNPTKLNSVPRREFMLYIGSNRGFAGVPTWMSDKVNWAFGCDQIEIDGVSYQNPQSAKWEVKRTDPLGTQFVGLTMTIVESNNLFLQSLKTGTTPPKGFTVVELSENYFDRAADFNVVGIFKKYTLLKNISVNLTSGTPFTLKVGITPGGSEVFSDVIPVPSNNQGYNQDRKILFLGPQTLYVTGITIGTATADILFDYLQYDEAPSGSPSLDIVSRYGQNDIGMWEANDDTDFERDWDLSTGFGKIGSEYYMCRMCDGRNGTVNRGGTVAIGYCQSTNTNYIGISAWNVTQNGYTGYDQFVTPSTNPNNPMVGTDHTRDSISNLAPHSHPINTTNSASSSLNEVDPIRGKTQGTVAGNRAGGGLLGTQDGPGGDGIHDSQTIKIAGGNTDGSGLGGQRENRQLSIVTLFFKGPIGA